MEIVPQSVWRWKIAAYLFLAGMGAGIFVIGVIGDFTNHVLSAKIAVTFGIPVVAFSTLFLIWDLGHPEKFFTAVLHPSTSWISRGFFILSGLIVFGAVLIGLWVWPFNILDSNATLRAVLEVIGLIFGVATCIYTGILIGIVVSRPFWNSPLLPMLFLISAVSTGIGGFFLIAPIWFGIIGAPYSKDVEAFGAILGQLDLVLIAMEAIIVYLYLAVVYDRAANAANLLLRGPLASLFWGGFVIVGLLLPFMIEYFALAMGDASGNAFSSFVAGILLLVGGFLLRALILAAGIRSPLYVRVALYVRPGV